MVSVRNGWASDGITVRPRAIEGLRRRSGKLVACADDVHLRATYRQ